MDDCSEDKIGIKLFAGFLLSSEIRMHLNESPLWKRSSFQDKTEFPLLETHFYHQDYVGIFLEESFLSLSRAHQIEHSLRKLLAQYCVGLSIEGLSIALFPQVFIS